MTITQLSDCRVLINLCHDDMKSFELSFDNIGFCDPHSKKILSRLTSLALTSSGLSTKNKTILLEALQSNDGCMILVSLSDKKRERKKYKIKRITEYPCYRFDSSENLLCAIEKLYCSDIFFYNNSAYYYKDHYYLVFDYPIVSQKAKKILAEYSNLSQGTKLFVARLNESAKKLSDGNAIVHIGSAL